MIIKNDTISITLNKLAFLNHCSALLFKGKMTDKQRVGIMVFYHQWIELMANGIFIPTAYLAYTLATVYHETAFKMTPLEEYGKGAGRPYGEPSTDTGLIYYGRGYVQTTWDFNYKKLSRMIKDKNGNPVDCYNDPDLLLIPEWSAQATLFGMRDGIYTGKSLSDYLDQETPDYVAARRVINGTDKADTIAGYAEHFKDAINLMMNRPVDRPLVRIGSKDVYVRELQLMLGQNPDGVFGKDTNNAVGSFQRIVGLNDDGIVGKGTWNELSKIGRDI